MHQYLIDRQAMEPGGKGRFPSKTTDFTKELDEDFLREVFGFRGILCHAKTEGIDSSVMALVEQLERGDVSSRCTLR
jgi:hypothetical protein